MRDPTNATTRQRRSTSDRPVSFPCTRRRFAFWCGMGLFALAERLRAQPLDSLAAAIMPEGDGALAAADRQQVNGATHWSAAENRTWRWFERETWSDGRWQVTGITTPIHKTTGERYTGATGYLPDIMIPDRLRMPLPPADNEGFVGPPEPEDDETSLRNPGQADSERRTRHGRPPSRWLRSLRADELHIWLKTIEVPEADVVGMTFWEHLTRDHSFDPTKIEGLDQADQAKLHAAAHFGY